jgi:hypothetical protein
VVAVLELPQAVLDQAVALVQACRPLLDQQQLL